MIWSRMLASRSAASVRFSSTVPSPARAGSVATHATTGAFDSRTVAKKSVALSGKWR